VAYFWDHCDKLHASSNTKQVNKYGEIIQENANNKQSTGSRAWK